MNVIILAAGTDAQVDGYPLWLADVDGKPLLEQLHDKIAPLNPKAVRVVLDEAEARKYHATAMAALFGPSVSVLGVKQRTAGAAASALLAASGFAQGDELLIVSANEFLDTSFAQAILAFRGAGVDAGVLTFDSTHPRYSYVRMEAGLVVEAAEKRPISRQATAGFYWFARVADFVNAAKEMIRKDAHVDGVFYVCPVLNELVLAQKRIGVGSLDRRNYHPLKSRAEAERELSRRAA